MLLPGHVRPCAAGPGGLAGLQESALPYFQEFCRCSLPMKNSVENGPYMKYSLSTWKFRGSQRSFIFIILDHFGIEGCSRPESISD